MAWYYGVNDSELYGSNFSTVLADAPPPLDDTYDEDENEIVFPNEAKKLKKFNRETAASSDTKSHSSDKKYNHDKSKHDGSRAPEGQGSVEEDPDFGDFAGFADFGSAFGQENSGESRDWFSGDENSTNSPPAVKTATSNQVHDNEVVDFAAFPENGGSLNQENITNGDFEQGNSNTSDNKKNYYHSENRNNSINGSYHMDSDDDFGDFASVEKINGRLEEVSTECESKTVGSQSDRERGCAPMGRTSVESDSKSDGVDVSSERKIAQCNGDTADKEVVSHCEESTVSHTSEDFQNVDKGQDNEFGTKRNTNNVENVSNTVAKDEELRLSDRSFAVVRQEDNQPGDSVFTEPEGEDDKIKNNVESDISSSSKVKESSENAVKLHNSTFEHDSDAKTLPGDSELNDDRFGEFADFTGPPIKQPSIDNEEEELCDKQIPHSPVSLVPTGDGNENSSCVQVTSAQNKGDDNEFGDFGSFDEGHDQNHERTIDFVAIDSRTECLSTQKGDNDDDDFGEFGSSNNAENTLPPEAQDSDDFGDFGTFKSETKDSQKVDDGKDDSEDFDISNSKEKPLSSEDQSAGDFGVFHSRTKDPLNKDDDGFGDFDTSSSGGKTVPREDQDEDDFGDFGTFNSSTRDSLKKDDDSFRDFGTSNSEEKSLPVPKEDQDSDDFGNFGAFDSSTRDSRKASDMDNDFGDFGEFESNTKRDEDNSDDFGSFESNAKDDQSGDSNNERFAADFGAFDAQAKDSSEKNESDNEFGDFGSFESRVKDLQKGEQRSSNVKDFHASELNDDGKFGDFKTSDSSQNSQKKKKLQSDEFGPLNSVSRNINNSRESKDDYGDFSGGEGKASSFATFPNSHSESSPRRNEDLKQRGTSALYFVPGNNVIIKQVGDAISPCFISEQRHISHCHCDVLSSRVQQSLESNLGLWQQLERSDKEGRILFHWKNSFSKHKKLLSLTIRPDRPPPLQGGAMLKPIVSSQSFGGGLPGSMLMPEPYSKLPQSPSGLSFMEPVKGSHLPVQSTTQNKMSLHQPTHPTQHEIGLPDLSFVLGNGLKPSASKSDIKDNVSDTTSESSSLDLDFFAPSTTQPSEGKPESRGLYEEDLLGLNIFSSSSLDSQKSDSPKPWKTSDTKKVWQHGGVTIPLSSQEGRAQSSAAAKSILDELEDLKFMSSSVLMFPLKV